MIEELRRALPALPEHMKSLPTFRGYPVPWFVWWPEGEDPEFRVIDPRRFQQAINEKRCWVCGEFFTNRRIAFVVGPMCCVNRISAEPPCHLECARFSALACPFLTRPHMVRRENDLPEDRYVDPNHHDENPGVIAVWQTRSFELMRHGKSILVRMGEPTGVDWYTESRVATRVEVAAALARRESVLYEEAGPLGKEEMRSMIDFVVENLLPREVA
jgi:hypothetical protein